ERLQNGADSRTGGITVAALLNGPRVTNDADHDIRRRGDPFFGDEEVQLARPTGAEACEQPLPGNHVVHEVHVSIDVEAEWGSPDLSHGNDRHQVSFLAATDQRHWGAMTRRLGHGDLNLDRWNHLEAVWSAVRSVITKEQCHRRSTARGSVQQTVDERLRVL